MSLIPAFEIGVWNGWLFMVFIVLPWPIDLITRRGKTKATELSSDSPFTRREKFVSLFSTGLVYLAILYSVFLPLRLGTAWLYVGLPIGLAGLIVFILATITFVTNPDTGQPATIGIYRFSRHPIYLGILLISVGVSIAAASWPFMLYAVLTIILLHSAVGAEERFCLGVYGQAYRDYMHRTPRWLGMPKSG